MALYKKGLKRLENEEFILEDEARLKKIEREIMRTEGLCLDQSLKPFETQNKVTADKLIKMDGLYTSY